MAARAEVHERLDPQDVLALDPSTLDPKLHYRFCHPRSMARRKAQGYEVVLRSETGVKLQSDHELLQTADDLVRVGDLVLMACEKELFKRRREQLGRLARERLGSSEKNFEARAKRRGVRSLTGDEGETR